MSSRVRTGRAIRGIPHPPSCTRAERREVERVVVDALEGLPSDLSGKYYSLKSMSDEEQEQLIQVNAKSMWVETATAKCVASTVYTVICLLYTLYSDAIRKPPPTYGIQRTKMFRRCKSQFRHMPISVCDQIRSPARENEEDCDRMRGIRRKSLAELRCGSPRVHCGDPDLDKPKGKQVQRQILAWFLVQGPLIYGGEIFVKATRKIKHLSTPLSIAIDT